MLPQLAADAMRPGWVAVVPQWSGYGARGAEVVNDGRRANCRARRQA